MITHPIQEGYIPFKGYKTWYRIVGEKEEPGKLPLLCLHGGPVPVMITSNHSMQWPTLDGV